MSHPEHAAKVTSVYEERWKSEGLEEQKKALVRRVKIATELFEQEPSDVREALIRERDEEYEKALVEWKKGAESVFDGRTEEQQAK